MCDRNQNSLTDPLGLSNRPGFPTGKDGRDCSNLDDITQIKEASERLKRDWEYANGKRKINSRKSREGYKQQVEGACKNASRMFEHIAECCGPWSEDQLAAFAAVQTLIDLYCNKPPSPPKGPVVTPEPVPIPIPIPNPGVNPSPETHSGPGQLPFGQPPNSPDVPAPQGGTLGFLGDYMGPAIAIGIGAAAATAAIEEGASAAGGCLLRVGGAFLRAPCIFMVGPMFNEDEFRPPGA